MGEIADQLINGDSCVVCGVPFEDNGEGFSRTCDGCLNEQVWERMKVKRKAAGKENA